MMIHYFVGAIAFLYLLGLVVTQFTIGLEDVGILNSKAFDSSAFAIASSFFVYYAAAGFVLCLAHLALTVENPLLHLIPVFFSIAIVIPIYAFAKPNGSVWSMTSADLLKMPGFGVLTTIKNVVPSPTDRTRRKSPKEKVDEVTKGLATYEISPQQSVEVLGQFEILHEGYGHRITNSGDRSFFSFKISDSKNPADVGGFGEFVPVEPKHTFEWKNLSLRILSCEDEGPPHNQQAKVKFTATLLKTLLPGERHILKAGEAVYAERGPTLKVKAFGHDEDDGGGQTVADLLLVMGDSGSSLMMFNSPSKAAIEKWRGWDIQIHRWINPGPPHGDDEAIEVSITKRPSK